MDSLRSEIAVIVGWLVIERQRRIYLEASFDGERWEVRQLLRRLLCWEWII